MASKTEPFIFIVIFIAFCFCCVLPGEYYVCIECSNVARGNFVVYLVEQGIWFSIMQH